MRIVHLVFSFNGNEAENLLLDIMSEQIKSNKVLFVIVNRDFDPFILSKVPAGIKTVLVKRQPGSRGIKALFKLIWLNLVLL